VREGEDKARQGKARILLFLKKKKQKDFFMADADSPISWVLAPAAQRL
jgi:hypothetical protein